MTIRIPTLTVVITAITVDLIVVKLVPVNVDGSCHVNAAPLIINTANALFNYVG